MRCATIFGAIWLGKDEYMSIIIGNLIISATAFDCEDYRVKSDLIRSPEILNGRQEMEPILGQIIMVPWDWAPAGWLPCDGQLLPISHHHALFSLIGTYYGGDGITNFALPDLRGRAPIHQGTGPGLTNRVMGESAGAEAVTLLTSNMPAHSHPVVFSPAGVGRAGAGRFLATQGITNTGPNSLVMDPSTITPMGDNIPHNNMQPYVVVNYIIAIQGIYPSRP